MSPVSVARRPHGRRPRRTGRHPGKRLSPWRVLLAVGVVAAVAVGAWAVPIFVREQAAAAPVERDPVWFGGYFDVTAAGVNETPTAADGAAANVLLAFVVATAADQCTPSWGAAYSLGDAATALDLDRRVERMRQQGSDVAVSFGGADNTELAGACMDVDQLAAAYGAVVDRYGVSLIDLDIEGDDLADKEAGYRRAQAVATLQAQKPGLEVWLTLPVGLDGLTEDGIGLLEQMLIAGVDVTGVNLMTMDYGVDLGGRDMAEASQTALEAAHGQLSVLADRYEVPGDVWSRMGATPMIGQNDVPGEVFSLGDAAALNRFAVERGMSRMSMWSLNRDRTCGENYPNTDIVSDACSGIDQGDTSFATVLSRGFDERPDPTPQPRPTATAVPTDDPATSPYPIWSAEATYSAGVKVVWHGSVYAAKWWTQGLPEPDDPTLVANETPWLLIGPVMPDDAPYALPTLPPGTYPDWSGDAAYVTGDRVLFQGTPYEAKWWTQGESPASAATDHDRSPWRLLEG